MKYVALSAYIKIQKQQNKELNDGTQNIAKTGMNKSKPSIWLEIRKVRLEINEIETNKETEQ